MQSANIIQEDTNMKNQMTHYNPFGLVDPFFDDFFTSERKSNINQVMKTDIKDNGDYYEFKIEVPEIQKENIHLSLDEGYLTIEASVHTNTDQKEKGHYVRKERYYGNFSRSYYIGEGIKEEDIKATLENGILTLIVKKSSENQKEKKYITIE